MIAGSLVWIKGMRGRPIPEKWSKDLPRKELDDPNAPVILKEYELNAEEFSLTIAILEQRCPYP